MTVKSNMESLKKKMVDQTARIKSKIMTKLQTRFLSINQQDSVIIDEQIEDSSSIDNSSSSNEMPKTLSFQSI